MRFHFECEVPASVAGVFRFHENPANLTELMAGWPGFRVLRHAGNVHPGSETWVEQSIAGVLPMVLGFRHTLYEPPGRFQEKLIHGPFSFFLHTHEFVSTPGGTVIHDWMEVRLPWYYGGEWAMRHLAGPGVERMFRCRHQALLARRWDAGAKALATAVSDAPFSPAGKG